MKRNLLVVALIALLTLVGMVGVSGAADKEIQTVITELQDRQMVAQRLPAKDNGAVQSKPKMYYLTSREVPGDQAPAACSSGFHMANLFEILDTSNLHYAKGLPGALSDPVQVYRGDGPPTIDFGWVQIAYASTPDPTRDPYEGLDCNNGSGRLDSDWGAIARLYDRAAASQINSEWQGICARVCNQSYHVWCVENM